MQWKLPRSFQKWQSTSYRVRTYISGICLVSDRRKLPKFAKKNAGTQKYVRQPRLCVFFAILQKRCEKLTANLARECFYPGLQGAAPYLDRPIITGNFGEYHHFLILYDTNNVGNVSIAAKKYQHKKMTHKKWPPVFFPPFSILLFL